MRMHMAMLLISEAGLGSMPKDGIGECSKCRMQCIRRSVQDIQDLARLRIRYYLGILAESLR